MRISLIIVFVVCIAVAFAGQESCKKPCPRNYNPVCGQRTVEGKLEKKVFSNACAMKNANDCGGGYEQCSRMPVDGDSDEQ